MAAQHEVYKAPTSSLENDKFTIGTAQDAANFEEVWHRLACYIAVNFEVRNLMAQTAIEQNDGADLDPNATRIQEKKLDTKSTTRTSPHGRKQGKGHIRSCSFIATQSLIVDDKL